MKNYRIADHLKFIIPSLIGIILFMVPFADTTEDGQEIITIPIAILSGWVETALADQLSFIMMIIISITALGSIVIRLTGPALLDQFPFFQSLFYVSDRKSVV